MTHQVEIIEPKFHATIPTFIIRKAGEMKGCIRLKALGRRGWEIVIDCEVVAERPTIDEAKQFAIEQVAQA